MSLGGVLAFTLDPPWNIIAIWAAVVVACTFVLDANWMVALLRGDGRSAPPPLFKSPIRIVGQWRQAGYLSIAVLVVAPMMMQPVMGIGRLAPSAGLMLCMAAIAVGGVLIFVAQATGFPRLANVAAAMMAVVLNAPYVLAGPVGWLRYGVVVGLLVMILGLLFVIARLHGGIFGYRPRSRGGAVLRLIADMCFGFAVVAAAFWPIGHA